MKKNIVTDNFVTYVDMEDNIITDNLASCVVQVDEKYRSDFEIFLNNASMLVTMLGWRKEERTTDESTDLSYKIFSFEEDIIKIIKGFANKNPDAHLKAVINDDSEYVEMRINTSIIHITGSVIEISDMICSVVEPTWVIFHSINE